MCILRHISFTPASRPLIGPTWPFPLFSLAKATFAPSCGADRLVGWNGSGFVFQPLDFALIDEPMANSKPTFRISEATRFSIPPATAGTSGARKTEEGHPSSWLILARSRQGTLTRLSTALDRNEEEGTESPRAAEERDKEGDGFELIRGNETMKETLLAPLSRCSRLLLNSCSVPVPALRLVLGHRGSSQIAANLETSRPTPPGIVQR